MRALYLAWYFNSESLPEDMRPEVDQTLVASECGGEHHVIITDANHPLVGEGLILRCDYDP